MDLAHDGGMPQLLDGHDFILEQAVFSPYTDFLKLTTRG